MCIRDSAIAFRVDAGVVQHVFALRHPQKARALLIGLGPQLRNLQKALPVREGAVGLPVRHDVLRRGAVQTGYIAQQAGAGGVQVNTHGVDAVLHLSLIHI